MALPPLVLWLLRRVVPGRRADTVIADLEDDYATRQAGRGARLWLTREALSLLISYGWARLSSVTRSVPLWIRDAQMVMRGFRQGALPLAAATVLLSVGLSAVLVSTGLAHALLLRSVSSVHTNLRRIVAVDRDGRMATRFSHSELQVIRDQVGDAGEITAVYLQPVVLRISGRDFQTMAEIIDGGYFSLTGTRTRLGRPLLALDDRREAAPAVVLSEPFWRQHLGSASSILGGEIRLNGTAYTVVGVTATIGSSTFLGASVDAWVTSSHADPLLNAGWRSNVRDRWFTTFVMPVRDVATVEHRVAAAAPALAAVYGEPWQQRRLQIADATVMVGSQRTAATMLSLVLGSLAVLILVAAASNVGGVLLARAAANQRSAAIHLSIGAGRAAVVRRQVIEGAILGAVAGGLALAWYVWARTTVSEVAILPTLALRLELPLTLATIALAIIPGLVTGVLLAFGPALWSTRIDVATALRDDSRGGTATQITRVRRLLVSAQVGLSLVLIVGAALFLRSVDSLTRVDLGFPREQLAAMDFDVEPMMSSPDDLPVLAREALARVNRMPEVAAAAMSDRAPVDQSTPTVEVQAAGQSSTRIGDVTVSLATERYFSTVGVPIVSGRAFAPSDAVTGADVVILNDALAARLFPDGDVIGRSIDLPMEAATLRIVGVARNSKYRTLTETARPHIYRPTAPGLGLALLIRARGDTRAALRAVQRELDTVGPGLIGFFPRTLDDHLAVQLLPARAAAQAATVLGVLALALSAAALYALVSWFVALRRREIGVRMALGASAGDVRRLVVRQALYAAAPGMTVGSAIAVALGSLARSALYGVSPADPLALGAGIAAMVVVVVLASYVPSRAAAKTDPLEALRQ